MNLPQPFSLPSQVPARRHGPAGYRTYESYKDWLRDEFAFHCVYCLERETWYPSRQAAFAVDHILAQSRRPDLICDYDNLVYACLRCNSLKQDVETLDPSRTVLREHIFFQPDGHVVGLTDDGREFILLFHLDEAPAREVREQKSDILQMKERCPDNADVDKLFRDTFGYPADLPDLRAPAKRPGTNSRPDGVHDCHFVRKLEGRLPHVY